MKRWLLLGLVCVIAGIFLLELIQRDAGYLLISVLDTTVETSFWFAVLVLLVVIVFVYLTIRLIRRILGTFVHSTAWLRGRRTHLIERQYREGLLCFLTENWQDASKQLSAVSRRKDLPVVRSIAAALSLAKLGDTARALNLLEEAEQEFVEDRVWILKARLRLQMDAKKIENSEQTFRDLKQLVPHDRHLNVLELELRMLSEQWTQAAALLPSTGKGTKKSTVVETTALDKFIYALDALAKTSDIDDAAVDELWVQVPKKFKSEPRLVNAYVNLLLASGRAGLAEDIIVFTLDKQWVPELIDSYAKISSSDTEKQLANAERWRKKYPESSDLLLTLGMLSAKNQLWGKARAYLEQALTLRETPQAYYVLGLVAEKLGESDLSNGYYKKAAGINWSVSPEKRV